MLCNGLIIHEKESVFEEVHNVVGSADSRKAMSVSLDADAGSRLERVRRHYRAKEGVKLSRPQMVDKLLADYLVAAGLPIDIPNDKLTPSPNQEEEEQK